MMINLFGRKKARKQSRRPAVKAIGNGEERRKKQLKKCMGWSREMMITIEPESNKALRLS